MHMMSAQCTCKQTDSGQIWIMGSPLFYSYKVQYDREPEPRPQRREDQSRIEKNVPHASGNLVWGLQPSALGKAAAAPAMKALECDLATEDLKAQNVLLPGGVPFCKTNQNY